jgi:hypothetical protein
MRSHFLRAASPKGGGGWSALSLDPVLWLDSSDLSTITESSSVVSAWRDKSGNGNDAVVFGSPIIGVNGMEITGSNKFQFGATSIMATGATGASLLMVWRWGGTGGNNYSIMFCPGGNAQDDWYPFTDNRIYSTFCSTSRVSFAVDNKPPSVERILRLRHSGTELSGAIDGGTTNSVASTFGRSSGGGSQELSPASNTAYIREIIVCDTSNTAAELEEGEGYLAHKWGLEASLPGGHSYKSSPP